VEKLRVSGNVIDERHAIARHPFRSQAWMRRLYGAPDPGGE
jgi:hypothetical protein